jgi:hypothetical protein
MIKRIAFSAVVAGAASVATASTGSDLMLAPFPEGTSSLFSADALIQGEGSSSRGMDASINQYEASGRFKFDLQDVSPALNRLSPRVGFDVFHLQANDDSNTIPDNLTDSAVAAGVGLLANDKWLAALTFGLGFAGENYIGDGDGWYGKADLIVGYKIDDTRSLGFVVSYHGNRTFMPDVPLPGFVYTQRFPDKGLTLALGIPFADVTWKPDEKWTLKFTYLIPETINVDIEYRVVQPIGLFAALDRRNAAFASNRIANNADRYLFSQWIAEAGARWYVTERFNLVLSGGYAFGQEIDVGFDSRDSDELIEFSDAPFVRIGGQLEF